MTEPEQQPPPSSGTCSCCAKEDFDELLDRAAERGADVASPISAWKTASAAQDIRDLRDLLEAWRDAPHGVADHQVSTTGVLAALLVGVAIAQADGRRQ